MNSLASPIRVTFAALVAAAGTTASAQTVSLRVVAVSGMPAPGLPTGTTFDGFDSPRLNERGGLAFCVRLAGPGIDETNDGSIWTDRAGSIAIVYREDDSAPFGADIRFAALPLPAFNDFGSLAFTAGLHDNSGPLLQPPNLGVFTEDAQHNLIPIAREGFNLPGLTRAVTSLPMSPFNNAGETAFSVSTGVAGRGAGLYTTRDPAAGPQPLVLSGDPAPGTAPGLETVFIVNPAQNQGGTVAYRTAAMDPGAPVIPDDIPLALWVDAGARELVAWTDPTTPPLGQWHFDDLSQTPHLTHDDRVTFWASRVGDLITPENDAGLWRYSGGVNTRLVQEGDAAPGTGATFKRIPRQFAHTPFGRIAFTASLTGAGLTTDDNSGIWTNAFTGSLELLVREGDGAPGLTGVFFGSLSDPSTNHAGQIAFTAHLRGPGAGPGTNHALFATDQLGRIHLVARMGDTISLPPGGLPTRVIREITFTHDRSTGRSQFAADGRLIFSVIFVDWSSAIMETRVGCRADVNGDGALDILDFVGFANYFATGDPRGDFSPDARFDLIDFIAFQSEFVAGCP